jgi:hypothetical protein
MIARLPTDRCCVILLVEGPELEGERCGKPAVEWWRTLLPIDGRFGSLVMRPNALCKDCATQWRAMHSLDSIVPITYEEALVMYIHSI